MLDLNWIFFFTNAFLFVFIKGKDSIFLFIFHRNNIIVIDKKKEKRRKEGFSNP